MNDELGNFIIKFTTKGFEDVNKQLDKLNKSMDSLNDHFGKAEKKGESFFGALVKWTTLTGGLVAVWKTLKNTIDGVFNTADKITDLYKNEQTLGVEAKVLERYGIASRRLGGSQEDAYSFFHDVNNMMSKFQTGQFSKEDAEMFARLGLSFQYNKNMDLAGNRAAYLDALRSAAQNADPNDAKKRAILESLIKPDSLRTLFQAKDADFSTIMDWSEGLRVWSKDRKDLQNAQNIKTVRMEWEQTLEEFRVTLMPIMTEVMQALKPLIPVFRNWIENTLKPWVERNKDNFANWITKGIEFLTKNVPALIEKLGGIINAIGGVRGVLKGIGDVVAALAESKLGKSVRMIWDSFKFGIGAMSEQAYHDKYFTEGSTEGGYAGDFARKLAGVKSGSTTNQNVTNNYGGNVTLTGGYYEPQTVNTNNLGANPAQFATPVMGG